MNIVYLLEIMDFLESGESIPILEKIQENTEIILIKLIFIDKSEKKGLTIILNFIKY